MRANRWSRRTPADVQSIVGVAAIGLSYRTRLPAPCAFPYEWRLPGLLTRSILLRLTGALSPDSRGTRVYDPLQAGRRLARRTAAWQAGTTALLALALLSQGASHAVAASVGGAAILFGGALAARLMVGGRVMPANAVMARWFAGVVLKLALVFSVLLLGLGAWRLPPLALLAGIVVALLTQLLAAARR